MPKNLKIPARDLPQPPAVLLRYPAAAASSFVWCAPKPPLRTRNNRLPTAAPTSRPLILTTPTATSLTGPQPLTSSVPPIARHDDRPASWALSARSAQRTTNTKPTKPPHTPTVPAALRGSAWVRAYICGSWVSLRMRHLDVLRGTKELGGNSREAMRIS
nr:mucin-2-like isoform X2 [Odocoileus virginianus texanus]